MSLCFTTRPQPANMTTSEKILVSAYGLALRSAGDQFTLDDLAVCAWENYPDDFALTGYPQYPDAQRVQSKVYGATGLVYRGLLEFIETKVLRVTPAGRKRIKQLYEGLPMVGPARE